MRILQVIWSLRRGGAERVCIDLSHELCVRGHKVAIAMLADVNEWDEILHENSVETIPVSPGRSPRWRTEFLTVAIRLGRVLSIFDPDIVHTHCEASTIVGWLSGYPPNITTIHGTHTEPIGSRIDLFGKLNRYLYRRSIERVPAYIVSVTPEAIPRICKALDMNTDRIRTIWNGIKVDPLTSGSDKQEHYSCLKLGMVGSLIPQKNHELAIRGMRALRDKGVDARLHICGEGSHRPSLESLVSQLDLREFIIFKGVCTDIPSFLCKIDIFWMTSHYEGHSIALLEAMAAGIPSIVTDVPGFALLTRLWKCAVVVPANDSEALAMATLRLVENQNEAKHLSARSRDLVQSLFTVERMVDEYEALYQNGR